MKCPRRVEGPFLCNDKDDSWREDDTCSYCGSLNPETLMKRVELGDVEITPTDKSYKIYIDNFGGENFKMRYRNCPIESSCKGPHDCTHWTTEERAHSKFYFQHLSEEQMQRFLEVYNQKKMILKYPGYFYVRPFFVAKT